MIFVDTGAFLGRYLKADSYHLAALACWQEIEMSGERCVISNFVFSETLTLLGRRGGYAFAAEKGRTILASPRFEIVRASSEEERAALQTFQKFADQKVSFTDCISFELMRARRLSRVFTFDRHFDLAGFSRYPGFGMMVHEPPPTPYGSEPQSP